MMGHCHDFELLFLELRQGLDVLRSDHDGLGFRTRAPQGEQATNQTVQPRAWRNAPNVIAFFPALSASF